MGFTLQKSARSSWSRKMNEFRGRAGGNKSILSQGGLDGRSCEEEGLWGIGRQLWVWVWVCAPFMSLCASLVFVGRVGPYKVEKFCVCVLVFVCHGFWKFHIVKKFRSLYVYMWGF